MTDFGSYYSKFYRNSFLGLDPNEETDGEVDLILTDAQMKRQHEEWVRVVSGLVHGIMFEGSDDNDNDGQRETAHRALRGKEADGFVN
jgi:hypothetical protein